MGGLFLYPDEDQDDALVLIGLNGARFRLEEDGVLGEGTFGAVRRARQESTGMEVAVKFLKPGPESGDLRNNRLWRFQRETDILMGLIHPGIVRLHTSGVDAGGRPWLAMDLVSGGNLTKWVGSENPRLKDRLEVFIGICDAVRYANELGVIHRDLKPDNIVVDGRGQARLIDFGLARWENDDLQPALTLDQSPGTPMFTAPELLSGKAVPAGARTDEYSLGVVLYWLVGGAMPYDARLSPFELVGTIQNNLPAGLAKSVPGPPGDLIAIVNRAMDRDPARRYGGAGPLGADVRRYLAGEPVEARRGSMLYVIEKFVLRHWKAVAASVLLVGCSLAAAVFHVRRLEDRTAVASAAYREARSQMAFTINEAVEHLRDVGRMDSVGYFVAKAEHFPWDLPVGDAGKSAPAWETGLLKARVDYLNGEACMDQRDPSSALAYFEKAEELARKAAAETDAPPGSAGLWMEYRIAALRAALESGLGGQGKTGLGRVADCLTACRDFPEAKWREAVHSRARNGAALLGSAWPMLVREDAHAASDWLAGVGGWLEKSLENSPRNTGSLKGRALLFTLTAEASGDGAGGAWETALGAWEAARRMAPFNVELAQGEIECRLKQSAALRKSGDLDGALAAWRRGDTVIHFLRDNWIFPTSHGSDELLCREWVALAASLVAAKRYEELLTDTDRMESLMNGFLQDVPPGRMVDGKVPDFWPVFAQGQLAYARALAATGDARKAAQFYSGSSARLAELRRLEPDKAAHWMLLRGGVLLEWGALRAVPPLDPGPEAILGRAMELLSDPILKDGADRAEADRLSGLVREALAAAKSRMPGEEGNVEKNTDGRHTEGPDRE